MFQLSGVQLLPVTGDGGALLSFFLKLIPEKRKSVTVNEYMSKGALNNKIKLYLLYHLLSTIELSIFLVTITFLAIRLGISQKSRPILLPDFRVIKVNADLRNQIV